MKTWIKDHIIPIGIVFAILVLVALCSHRETKFEAKCKELCESVNSSVLLCKEDRKFAICE